MYQNLRAATIKLLEENLGVNLFKLRLSNAFLDTILKAQVTKQKNRQIAVHQNYKRVLHIKNENKIYRMGENTSYCKYISAKRLVSRI